MKYLFASALSAQTIKTNRSPALSMLNDLLERRVFRTVAFALLLLPFFEPFCFYYLEDYLPTSRFAIVAGLVFLAARLLISAVALLHCLRIRNWTLSHSIVLGFSISMVVATLVTSPWISILKAIASAVSFVGLVALLHIAASVSLRSLIEACFYLFGILTVGNFASVLLTGAEGLIPGRELANRIFFFGGKNSAFMYGIPLIAITALLFLPGGVRTAFGHSKSYGGLRKKVYGLAVWTPALCAILYAGVAAIVGSKSSMLCFAMVCIGMILFAVGRAPRSIFNVWVYGAVLVIALFATVLFQDYDSPLGFVLAIFDRSPTFSGRDIVWEQALVFIQQNPLFGVGPDAQFVLRNGAVTNNAHSYYLDVFAKYGIICIFFLLWDFVYLASKAVRSQFDVALEAMTFAIFVLLFHSLYDTLHFTIYVLLRTLTLLFLESKCEEDFHTGERSLSPVCADKRGMSMDLSLFLRKAYARFVLPNIKDTESVPDVSAWKDYLENLPIPKDCIDASFNKYLCRMYHFPLWKKAALNAASAAVLLLLLPKSKKAAGSVPKEPNDVLLLQRDRDVGYEDVFPCELEKGYAEIIIVDRDDKYGRLCLEAQNLYRECRGRHKFSFYYALWLLKELSAHSLYLLEHNPSAVAVYVNERNIAGPVVTKLYENLGRKCISFMHGEYLLELISAYTSFSEYYVWDEWYVGLFSEHLKCDKDQFKVYTPGKLVKKWRLEDITPVYDCTYYFSGESLASVVEISKVFRKLREYGIKCKVRPHPRQSHWEAIRREFEGFCIEDPEQTSLERSLGNTRYAVGLFSTVLSEAWVEGRGVIVDDVGDPIRFADFQARKSILFKKGFPLFSNVLDDPRAFFVK